MTGFAKLTTNESTVLKAFTNNAAIAYPVDCGAMSNAEIAAALQSLKQLGLVTGSAPYRLTKKGKRTLKEDN